MNDLLLSAGFQGIVAFLVYDYLRGRGFNLNYAIILTLCKFWMICPAKNNCKSANTLQCFTTGIICQIHDHLVPWRQRSALEITHMKNPCSQFDIRN